jgi:hypothetical protein
MLAAARDLYGLAPAEFTAARNQLAKQLKADGQADDAKAIGGLRRPKVSEYALNRVAREDGDAVRRFADAIVGAQRAQAAAIGGDAGALRDATNELRQANAAVVDAAVDALTADGGNGEAQRDDIVALLREFISGANTAPLVAGVIGSEALISADELFPGAPEPPPERAKPPATKGPTTAKAPSKAAGPPAGEEPRHATTKEPSKAAKSTDAAKKAMRRAEHTQLEDALRAAEAAVAKAATAVEAAQTELTERRAALKAAQAAAKSAAKELAAFDAD